MKVLEQKHATENPPLDERVWQAWIIKNRRKDKARAATRMVVLLVGLGVVLAAFVIRSLFK